MMINTALRSLKLLIIFWDFATWPFCRRANSVGETPPSASLLSFFANKLRKALPSDRQTRNDVKHMKEHFKFDYLRKMVDLCLPPTLNILSTRYARINGPQNASVRIKHFVIIQAITFGVTILKCDVAAIERANGTVETLCGLISNKKLCTDPSHCVVTMPAIS